MYPFETLKKEYADRWSKMLIPQKYVTQVQAVAHKLELLKDSYETHTGIPWQFLAAIHYRESNNDMRGQLLNGEHWNQVTRLVPKGLGPWHSFEDALAFAVTQDGLNTITEWSIERLLYQAEKWNGFGYRQYHKIASPYVWSHTNQYSGGKYTNDGKYDASVYDVQLGVAALFKILV